MNNKNNKNKSQAGCLLGCIPVLLFFCMLTFLAAVYFIAPMRTNMVLVGTDFAQPGSTLARSDTLIVVTVEPLEPYIGLLSVPRDLWVVIPGIGENRINTAHFYAEAELSGAGPYAAMETVEYNFGVPVKYFARIRFEGLRDVVDAMGGVNIQLEKAYAGYPPGTHYLTGKKALAFARNRAGSDDFFRMEQGQILLKSIMNQSIQPGSWSRLPGVVKVVMQNLYTNLPWWQWPRLGLAFLRTGGSGLDSRTISRDMVQGYTTDQGAQVLLPRWELIDPLVAEMFGIDVNYKARHQP